MSAVPAPSTVVVDVDGTLYFQPRLRRAMAATIIRQVLRHPTCCRELLAVALFRRMREHATGTAPEPLYDRVARRLRLSPQAVAHAVAAWMDQRPGQLLGHCRDAWLADRLAAFRAAGGQVVAWSDYPARAKLATLNVRVDACVDPDDARLTELKPSPQGLELAIEMSNGSPRSTVVIGDRDTRDGAAARRMGVQSIIVARHPRARRRQHRTIAELLGGAASAGW
ncbi:MAG: HAD hydrolase-like protein [Bifidobacteriaceae bacterium]|jgi:phosphoglycolate phosphatase/putative hydrolase of the HAD superfamily|nr:HAD hydrolase-like protein [Bifidobacteriaceae bacterium]